MFLEALLFNFTDFRHITNLNSSEYIQQIRVSSKLNYCKNLIMNVLNRNINNIFFIFVLSHLIIWTLVPSLTNKIYLLDTIEALAWGSNLDWGFSKHPPMSAFFLNSFLFYLVHKIGLITC